MAKSDARNYFKEIENQYNEIKEILEDVNSYYEKGEMSEEAARDALADFERAQLVYDTARIFLYKMDLKKPKKGESEVVELPESLKLPEIQEKENK